MRGEISSGRHAKRHPLDWYVDEPWCTSQLMAALGNFRRELLAGLTIWDPCCGRGTIPGEIGALAAFSGANHALELVLSDVVCNLEAERLGEARRRFFSADFLACEAAPAPCSVVCNPPYSYLKVQGVLISELFARHAIKLVAECGGARVCMLVPNKWLASQSRYRLFAVDHPPAAILHLTQRASMPPGDRIAEMGNRAFSGGMVDYCWVVWDVQRPTKPGETRTVWLPPLGAPIKPVEGLA